MGWVENIAGKRRKWWLTVFSSIFQIVFKRLHFQGHEKSGLYCKGLNSGSQYGVEKL